MSILLFFINPILGLISAFTLNIKKHSREFYFIILLFSLYFGFILTPLCREIDSYRIVQLFNNWNITYPSYLSFIKDFLTFRNSAAKDLYEGTIFSLVHSFSSNYHWIFFLCALFFTVFKLLSFNTVFNNTTYKFNLKTTILVIVFFISIPLFEINGFRFFTAAWIAIYSTLKVIGLKNFRYIALLLICPLVHITFLFYIIAFFISYFLCSFVKDKFIIVFFCVSVLFGLICESLPNIGNYDGIIGNLSSSYINEDYKEDIDSAVKASNVIRFYTPLRYLFYNTAALIAYKVLQDTSNKVLGLWCLAYLAISNCVRIIPDMSRFFITILPVIICLMNLSKNNKRISILIYMMPVIESFHIYQVYITSYPQVIPHAAMYNVILGLLAL